MVMNNNQTTRICPECGKHYMAVPALSRKDNQTLICPDCGIIEALQGIGIGKGEQQEILEMIHRFTKQRKDSAK